MNVGGGSKTSTLYFNLTICLHSISERYLDNIIPNKKHQMKILTQTKIESKKNLKVSLTRIEADICIDTFTRVMWLVIMKYC